MEANIIIFPNSKTHFILCRAPVGRDGATGYSAACFDITRNIEKRSDEIPILFGDIAACENYARL
jgi:hypothetical protein